MNPRALRSSIAVMTSTSFGNISDVAVLAIQKRRTTPTVIIVRT